MAYNIFRVDEEVKMKRKRSDMDDNNNDNNVTDNVTNFRTVNACNRCRQRKNRCDQKLPACSGCEKYGVACVGYDPLLRRQIPRRFACHVMWLDPFTNHLKVTYYISKIASKN